MKSFKQILLNEIGDTERGRAMLKRYVRAARRDREEAIARGNDIQAEIQNSLPTTGRYNDPNTDEVHNAEAPANELFGKAARRWVGIHAALRRLLGMNEDFGEHSGELLNEIGDTLRGKIKLVRYLNSRSKDLESLGDEAKRLDDVKQTHMKNIRKNRIPSDRVIDTLYNMGVNLTNKENRYRQGMRRAVRSLGLPFLGQDNTTTIKEHYIKILTEATAKKKQSQENIEGGDMTKPYRTPRDILDIMNRNTGDDSAFDWSEHNTAEDQGRRRGAESVGASTEDITPGMASERARSSSILSGVQGLPIRSSEEALGTSVPGRQYSNQEIAAIMNARGIKTLRGKQWTHQLVDQVAQKALQQLRLNNDLNSLMPKPSSNLGTSADH